MSIMLPAFTDDGDAVLCADSGYGLHAELHDDSFARRKQRRNRTTFTLQQVSNLQHGTDLDMQ